MNLWVFQICESQGCSTLQYQEALIENNFQTESKRKLRSKYWGKMPRFSSRVLFKRNNEFMTSKMELTCWNPFLLMLIWVLFIFGREYLCLRYKSTLKVVSTKRKSTFLLEIRYIIGSERCGLIPLSSSVSFVISSVTRCNMPSVVVSRLYSFTLWLLYAVFLWFFSIY